MSSCTFYTLFLTPCVLYQCLKARIPASLQTLLTNKSTINNQKHYEVKSYEKESNSIFLFLMQRYDEKQSIPRKTIKSSSTCIDKLLDLGQIGEKLSKSVQKSDKNLVVSFFFPYLCSVKGITFLPLK